MTLGKLSAYTLIPFSGYYITKLPLSPIYVSLALTLYLTFFILLYRRGFRLDRTAMYAIFFIGYIGITQLLIPGLLRSSINVVMSFFYFVFTLYVLHSLSVAEVVKLARRSIQLSIPLLVYEAYYRLSHPIFIVGKFDFSQSENKFFYPYKFNSVMYADSNFVGVFIVVLFGLAEYLKYHQGQKMKVERWLLFLLVLATISRAAIMVVIFCGFVNLLWNKRGLIKFRIPILIALSVGLVCLVGSIFAQDESMMVKFNLLPHIMQYLSNSNLTTIAFGYGLGKSEFAMGTLLSAHDVVFQNLIEIGVVGLLLLLGFWISVMMKTRGEAGYVLSPFVLVALSATVHAAPYFYSALAIICWLRSRKTLAPLRLPAVIASFPNAKGGSPLPPLSITEGTIP